MNEGRERSAPFRKQGYSGDKGCVTKEDHHGAPIVYECCVIVQLGLGLALVEREFLRNADAVFIGDGLMNTMALGSGGV